MMNDQIIQRMQAHKDIVHSCIEDTALLECIEQIVRQAVQVFRSGGRLLFCGNGGSAADAQHLAAELSGRFYLNRAALDAEALHVNGSYLTAVGNDFDFETIYERAVEAKGRKGDMLIVMTTSGQSVNIIRAAKKALEKELHVVAFLGQGASPLDSMVANCLRVPSSDTPRIQEMHMLFGHIICEQIERQIFQQ